LSGPTNALEGQSVHFTSTVSDFGATSLTYVWHVVSNNGQVVADGSGDTFDFVPVNQGAYTVKLTVTDNRGGSASLSGALNVANVAPSAGNTAPQAAKQYSDAISPVTITATDPGALDLLSASIVSGLPANSGLGLTWNPVSRSGVIAGKANLAPGTYNVDVRICDGDGGV